MAVQNPSDKRRVSVDVTTSKTLTAADCGIVQNVIAAGVTFTLPAAASGLCYTFRNGGIPAGGPVGSGGNKSLVFNVTPAAADGVSGNGFTAAVTKGITQPAVAQAYVGDEITIQAGTPSSVTAWVIEAGTVGTWTRQP